MASNRTVAQRKYDSAHCRYFYLKYNVITDKEIIKKLESVPSTQGYIRQLIKKDLAEIAINKKEGLTNDHP